MYTNRLGWPHHFTFSLRGVGGAHKTSLTPPLFIVPRQGVERLCICVLLVLILHLYTILIFDFGIVRTIWYLLFFILIRVTIYLTLLLFNLRQ